MASENIDVPTTQALLLALREIYVAGYAAEESGQLPCTASWTSYVAKALGKLCPVGCAPYGHDFRDEDCPEHLVDHVWALGDPGCDWSESTGLVLAMESELNFKRDKQWHDFTKLADVVADRRLFLGKLPPVEWSSAERRCEEWAHWLHRHRHFGDADEVGVVLMCGGGNWPFAGWLLRGDGSYSEVFRVEKR